MSRQEQEGNLFQGWLDCQRAHDKSKKEIYFKVGSTANALTLKNFTATSFNVNGTDYKISDSKLK